MTQLQILERKLLLKLQYLHVATGQINAEIEEIKNQIDIARRHESLLNGQAVNE